MKAKWIIIHYGQQDEDVQRLACAVQEIGRTAHVITLGQMFETILDHPSQEKNCVVVQGPTSITTRIGRARPMWVPGSWHNSETYKCSNYYAQIGQFLTQRDYTFLPLAEVDRLKESLYRRFNNDGKIFIRPDYGEKIFAGEVVYEKSYEHWQSIRSVCEVDPKTLCVVSRPVKIERELRLVMRQGKVVTGSTYRIMGMIEHETLDQQPNKNEIIAFAEKAASYLKEFPPVYVLDLAVDEFGLSVMEVGCVNCAGLYGCDLTQTVIAVSEEAEAEYQDYFG
jgi:hypothetical protein